MDTNFEKIQLNKYWAIKTLKQQKILVQLIEVFNEAENAVDKKELQETRATYITAKTSLATYWDYLMPEQRDALVKFITAFYQAGKTELQKIKTGYEAPIKLFEQLSDDQEKSLITFFDTAGIDTENGINITEYNKEIDEAEAEYERGEFYTQEQVVEMLKARFDGK